MSSKKQIFKVNTLKKLLIDENSCVSLVPTTRLLALPPFFLNDMKSGILYLLNNMLKKYDRSLGGIVIGYQNIKVLMDENTGIIPMGTSETEVNISVEFYIFQPKIGSFLEGVVNKKSNSHIGCLVHRYFNATILKPEDVDYDEWICQNFNVDDKIIFKVKDLDFTSLLPLIEGVIDNERLLDKVKSNLNKSFDLSSDIVNSVNKRCSNDVLLSENEMKNINDNKESTLNDNFNKNSLEFDSFIDLKKKKKKMKKEKEEKEHVNLYDNHKQMDKEEDLGVKEWSSDTLIKEFNVDEKYYVKKKKEKSKKKQEDADVKNMKNTPGNSNGNTSHPSNNLEKLDTFESKNINDFVRAGKIKKEKKKKKSELKESQAELNKTNQCLFLNEAEDNIFYSTQLDSSLPKKMTILCCSPISKSITFEEEIPKRDLKSEKEVDEKDKKQKRKKRKREEKEPEGFAEPKKIKTSHSSFSEKESTKDKANFNEDGSVVRIMMEELCRKQLDRMKQEFSKSEKESSKERKKKKKKLKNEEKMLNLSKSKKGQVNGGSGTEQNSEIHGLLDELQKQEIQRVKEELNISDRERCKEIKKIKMKVKEEKEILKEEARESLCNLKKSTKTPINSAGEDEKKLSVQDIMHQLLQQEINRVKEEFKKSDAKILKEGKKPKKVINKREEASKEKAHDSLYEKLLKEAKSAMDLDEGKISSLPPARDSAKKKKKDLSNLKTFFKMRGSMGKKDRNSQKAKDCREIAEKYKNGSMYDFEKSLFSDSEQSNSSPAKRHKEVNGIEANFIEDSPFKKETEAIKNGSGKKKERMSHKSEQDHDSLYEKLLREAKSLIQSRNEKSPIKKKTFSSL